MTRRIAVAALAAALLAGCATSSLTLLEDEAGGNGAVAVLGDKETVIDTPNSRTALGAGRPAPRAIGSLKTGQRALVDYLPKPPVSFTLYFVEGTTRITAQSRPTLDNIRAEIGQRPGAEVQVTGHTDTLGSDEDNDRLSVMRARDIVSVLSIEEGIDPALLTAVGRGERQLRVRTPDGERNADNRRVEVIVR